MEEIGWVGGGQSLSTANGASNGLPTCVVLEPALAHEGVAGHVRPERINERLGVGNDAGAFGHLHAAEEGMGEGGFCKAKLHSRYATP